jgi:hypothetical protein
MSEATITCPKCKTEIPLTETLTAPLLEAERKKFRDHLDREVGKLRQREAELEKATQNLDTQVEQRVEAVRSKIAEEEAQKARQVLQSDLTARTAEIQTLKETLQNRDEKLAEAQKAQAEIVRKERELEDAKREIDLTIENVSRHPRRRFDRGLSRRLTKVGS